MMAVMVIYNDGNVHNGGGGGNDNYNEDDISIRFLD